MRDRLLVTVYRPLAVAVLFGCIVVSIVQLIELLQPQWRGGYLVVISALAALEAQVSYRLIRERLPRSYPTLRYRLMELVGLFLVLQLAEGLNEGSANPLAGIPDFSPPALVAYGVVVACWLGGTLTARDLEALGETPERSVTYVPPEERLASRFLFGAVILLIFAGMTHLGLRSLFQLSRPPVGGVILNVLVYFLLGFLMLGQIRYSTLRAHWEQVGARVQPALGSRWLRYSLLFLVSVLLLVALLPTTYTIGLLETLALVLNAIIWTIGAIWFLISLPFLWLIAHLFGGGRTGDNPPPPRELPEFMRRPQDGGFSWPGFLNSLIFWAIVAAILVYVLRAYLRTRPDLLAPLARLRLLEVLRAWWRSLWARITGAASSASRRLAERFRAAGRTLGGVARGERIDPSRLDPRGRVRYYYLRMLEVAEGAGHPRRRSQTPYDFERTLGPEVPEAEPALDDLTSEFVRARYSRQPLSEEEAERARADVERIREELRRRQEARDTDQSSPRR